MNIANIKTAKKSAFTSFRFNIQYYEENMFFRKDKSCWAVYKLEGFSYDFKSKAERFNKFNNLTKLFWNLKLEHQIRIIPITSSISEDNEKLKQRITGGLKVQAIQEIDATTKDLTQLLGDEGNEYEFYVIVKLERPKSFFKNLAEFGKSLYQDPIRVVNEYAGLENPEIYLREVEAYKNFEEIAFKRMSKYTKIKRANEYIIQRLIRQPFYFGIGNPPIRGKRPKEDRFRSDKNDVWVPHADIIERHGEKMIRPHSKDILTLTEGEINKGAARHIEITQFYNGKEATTYQAYLVVSEMPNIPFPGGEWIYDLISESKFPLNISVRMRYLEYKASINEVRKKQKDLADQGEHISNSDNAIPLDLLESSEEAYNMEYDLKSRKFPLLLTTIIIGISAKDKETLNKRIEDVKGYLNDIQTEIPAGDQWLLFNEMILGGDQYANDYLLRLTPDHIAGAMIGATKQLGDDTGFYLGITGTLRKPVKIDPWRAPRENKAPNMTFSGSQGGGKSFIADLIACKSAKLGAHVVIIDPKGDRTFWENELRSFAGEVQVTTFTADMKDKGKLDPYNIMRTGATKENYIEKMKAASSQALDICMFLIAADRKDARTRLLLNAVNRVNNKKSPSMNKIIEECRIMASECDEKNIIKENMLNEIADTLDSYREMPYSSLLFGDGDEEAISLEKQINVLQIQNLVFPKENTKPEDFSFQEIVGYACLLAITSYIMSFIMGDKGILKQFVLDEATVMNATPSGRDTINKLQRMARALFSPGYFISQSVRDVGDEDVLNNIGYKFAFKSTNEKEISNILDYYKLEHTQENIDVIQSLENGMALFQDLDGRTGVIAIDAIFEEYLTAFDTKPESMSLKQKMYLGG